MLRKFLLICTILAAFSGAAHAQESAETEAIKSEKAELIDEFGWASDCDLGARLDILLVELNSNDNLRGAIIIYNGEDVLPANRNTSTIKLQRRIKQYITFRGFNISRIAITDGGFRQKMVTALWTFPNGAEPPQPTEIIPKPELPKNKTFLYDKENLNGDFNDLEAFVLDSVQAKREAERVTFEQENAAEQSPEEISSEPIIEPITEEVSAAEPPTTEESEAEKFSWANENFAELIKNQKDARGVLVFYADDQTYDVAKITAHIEAGKARIATAAKISPDKIQIVFGGYRDLIECEFWIVPKNGENPISTPEERKSVEPENDENTEPAQ